MRVNAKIQSLIDKLTATELCYGVQPSELAEAAFEPSYKSMEILQKNDSIQMVITFLEESDEGGNTVVQMRYTYNNDKFLMRIEQKIERSAFKVQWDRESEIASLLSQIRAELSRLNSRSAVDEVMESVPPTISIKIADHLAAVA